ncbi:T9SS type A sorting domain-containing protein [Rufibacter immobilis]|uniref:T9SS type A sorting domain-containing protein n=1 Tax=Rufibacter immobilis TaxID=1348778 RepID=UPI0035ECB1D1
MWTYTLFTSSLSFAQSSFTYTIGDYRTTSAGTLSQTGGTVGVEQLTAQGAWVPATYPLPVSSTLFVEHAAQLAGPLQVGQLYLAQQKEVTVPSGSSLLTSNGLTVAAGAVLTQEGEMENRGVLQLQANARLVIKAPSYQATSLLWAGTEVIDASAEVRIEAAQANALLFSGSQLTTQSHGYWFGKLTVALAQTSNQWKLTDSGAPLAAQTFTATLPASSSLLLLTKESQTLSFGQDVNLTGGTYFLQNQSAGTASVTVAGQLTLQNATLTLNQAASATAVSTVDLKGNLVADATSMINNSSTVNTTATSGIRFTGSAWQTLQMAGTVNHVSLAVKPGAMVRLSQHLRLNPSNSVYAGIFSIENLASLDFGTDAAGNGYQVQGQGYFKLEQGGTLFITSAQGINAGGTAGNVQVTDARRNFSQVATFVYSGKVPQQTGNALGSTSSGKVIIIDNPTTVAVTQNIGVSSSTTVSTLGARLEIRQGTLIASPTADITGAGKLVMSGGTYQVAANTTVPQLSGAYELTGGTVELVGEEQILRGKIYHKVIIGGSSAPKSISSTTTINQNISILPNAVLDISNKALKGDGGLTMTGGLLRISKTSNSQPELTGKNDAYKLTGGTVEFYGSINGQTQSIRGTYGSSQKITYHHLLLTAAEANTLNDQGNHLISANLDVSGTMTVAAPAVLQLASNRAIGGAGNFVLEAEATLLYGSAQGIKMSGTGTQDGNIRVSGTRSFSPQANYGFIGPAEMVSGDGLPATVANLQVAKTGAGVGVTLSKSVTVTNTFSLKSGLFKTGNNELSLASQAATALQLADSTFYIEGNLRRAVGSSGTYSFPVGNANGKRQLDLLSIGLSGNVFQSISVGFRPLTHHQDADLQPMDGEYRYIHLETEGVWYVEPNAQPSSGSFTAMAFLQGFPNLVDNKFALLIRPLASTSGRDWTTGGGVLDAPGKDGRTVASGYAKRNFIKPFGQLGIANMETVLPVTWLQVDASRTKQYVEVNWATATEVNNEKFEVEYAPDGTNFKTVGVVAGAGNSNLAKEYTFRHVAPSTSTGYYRIKQIDFDGKFEYSKTVAVQAGASSLAQVTLYPNPSHDFVYLSNVSLSGDASVEILDTNGRRVLYTKPVMTGATPVVEVRHLPAGTYLLKIHSGKQVTQQRFMKL